MGLLTVEITWLKKCGNTLVFKNDTSSSDIKDRISSNFSISPNDFYLIQNGRLLNSTSIIKDGPHIKAVPRLLGGKGGFGSMLRAIGAQIEKTTNREACRDLSGRRLRDINEEKRLKTWIAQQADRERQEADKTKRKIEKLRAQPKHEFSDKQYEEERSQLIDKVHDAVEHGFQSLAPDTASEASTSAGPSTSGASTSSASTSKTLKKKKPKKKGFMFEDEELSLSESDSDGEKDASSEVVPKKRAAEEDSEKDASSEVVPKKHVAEEDSEKDTSSEVVPKKHAAEEDGEKDGSSEVVPKKRAAEEDSEDSPSKKQKTNESKELDTSETKVGAVSS